MTREDAPAVVNPDGTPTEYTLGMLGRLTAAEVRELTQARRIAEEVDRLHAMGLASDVIALNIADPRYRFPDGLPAYPHTVRGQASATGWPYGTTHDMDCPGCVHSGASFTSSPRSETYWSS